MLSASTVLLFRFKTTPIFTGSTCRFAIKPCEMPDRISERWLVAGICAGLVALIWFVFGQSIRFPFANHDDPTYTYAAPQVIAGLRWHGVVWAFTHAHGGHWKPITTLSHMFTSG